MTAAPDDPVVPASAGQRQIWLAEQLRLRDLGVVGATYSTAEALTVDAELHRPSLSAALRRLAERHEILRTTVEMRDGALAQRVHPGPPVDVEWADLRGRGDHAAEFTRLTTASLERPFPLDRPSPWRALVAEADGATHVALILHHIAADGWSVALLLDDLAACYLAALGAGPEPAPPARTYRRFSEEQRLEAVEGERDASTAYWREAMRDAPATSAPPWLGPLPREAVTARAAQHFLPLSPQRYESVRRVAAGNHVTPYVVFLSAFVLALTRSVRRRDVVTALPSANRDDDEYHDVVGPFATLLPVRVRLPGTVSPGALVRLTADTVADVTKHQGLPLEEIVSCALAHTSARVDMPLFQTVALPRDWREPERTFAGVPARMVWTAAPAPKYHFAVSFPTNARDSRFVVEYDVHRYDRAMAEAFGRALDSALDEVLGGEEITVLGVPPAGTTDTTIHDQVAALARFDPDHPAVVAGRDWCSYGELDARARAAAAGLARRGVRDGDVVGIRLGRGVDFVVAVLACLHAGAAYVATDPSWPLPRIQQVLTEAAVAATIVPDDLVPGDLVPDGPPVAGLAELEDHGTAHPADLPAVGAGAPCYVCFTSGSTGVPKGAVVTHRSVLRLTAADQDFALDWTDRMAHQANLAFDATTWELWGALLVGATVVVGVDDPAPADYAALMSDCTTAFLPTGLFAELVRHSACQAAIAGLRVVGVGGGALPPGATEPILRAGRGQFNFYGPAESTATATSGSLAARTPWNTVPIGHPVHGTRAYLLDDDLRPVADGEIGDLYLAGAGLALGYRNDPRQTAERFLPDVAAPGERMYATGDRARRLGDGGLDYVGRVDNQVKIRGFRVEPGELEAALLSRPGVREAYAGLDGQGRLAAALRADPGVDPLRLMAELRATLPDYLVPHRITLADRLPLTRNGKVDVAALLRTTGQSAAGTSAGTPDGLLGEVIEIWAAVLDVPIRHDTEFFAAGGDSLTALRLLWLCGERFGVEPRPSDLYAHSTPAAFTAVLAERMGHRDEPA
ncbi:amino acid adenylation domain-containing protein [Amycolatopsis sp. cg9]|uniref:non-ribosomal peptide synthetase n=1 Tax=Amycolatopsis sp. cg9 TaxID=3238801 RepID=UPI003525A73C